jgi:DNA-binding NtrC family response regulator
MEYKWPGNIRDLRNVIERAVILESDKILHPDSLPQEIASASGATVNPVSKQYFLNDEFSATVNISLYDIERQAIIQALEMEGHNQTRAAKLLGITRDTLRYKLKKFGL